MFTRHTTKQQILATGTATLLLSLSAGTAMAVHTSPDPKTSHTQTQWDQTKQSAFVPQYEASSEVIGSKLMNPTLDEIGSIDDLVIDRRSGRIVFAIVSQGGVMGIGDELRAVDFGALSHIDDHGLRTNLTSEQFERQSRTLEDGWDGFTNTDWMEQIPGFASDDNMRSKKHNAHGHDQTELEGKITRVERVDLKSDECTVIHVQTEDGQTERVILGPSWYIMGLESAPKQGDRIEITAERTSEGYRAVRTEVDGRSIDLRSKDGNPAWDVSSDKPTRYVKLSDLIGKNVEINSTTGGEVQGAVLEMNTGRVDFIMFDPNDNLLGLGDKISLVPWSAIRVDHDSTVWSGSSEVMFERAIEMPDRVSDLTKSDAMRAYKVFGAELPEHESRDATTTSHSGSLDPWSRNAWLVEQFADGDRVSMTGYFRGTDHTKLQENTARASTMWLEVDGKKHQIVLGPNWYFERQQFTLEDGDKVTVNGRRAMVDGEKMIAAWSIEHNKNSWTLWNDTTPVWIGEDD